MKAIRSLTVLLTIFAVAIGWLGCTKHTSPTSSDDPVDRPGFYRSDNPEKTAYTGEPGVNDTAGRGVSVFETPQISNPDTVERTVYTVTKLNNGLDTSLSFSGYIGFSFDFVDTGEYSITQTVFYDPSGSATASMQLWILDSIVIDTTYLGSHAYLDSSWLEGADCMVRVYYRDDKLLTSVYNDPGRRGTDDASWTAPQPTPITLIEDSTYRYEDFELHKLGLNKWGIIVSISGDVWINIDPDSSDLWWSAEGIFAVVRLSDNSIWNEDTTKQLWPKIVEKPLGIRIDDNLYYNYTQTTSTLNFRGSGQTGVNVAWGSGGFTIHSTSIVITGWRSATFPKPSKEALKTRGTLVRHPQHPRAILLRFKCFDMEKFACYNVDADECQLWVTGIGVYL